MQNDQLGKLIEGAAERDAIHIAIAPVVAGTSLSPGQDVGFFPDGRVGVVKDLVGIIDPFLKGRVMPGERCYLLLYPNTITSLRHQWVHPAFGEVKPAAGVGESETWLRDYAKKIGMDRDALIEAARDYLTEGQYYSTGDRQFDIPDEFWMHYERVTGDSVKESDRGHFFSCSC